MLGVTSGGASRPRLEQWSERPCRVVDMHEVQVEADVLPHVGFHGGASISGPPCSGHREEMHQLRREDGSSRVRHKINWVGSSRRINHEEVASDSVQRKALGSTTTTEIVKNHGKGTTKGKIHPAPKKTSAKGNLGGISEHVQDRSTSASRDDRDSQRGLGEGQPMSDVPAPIDDDALCSHEVSESVFTCVRSMSDSEKEEIIRQLEESQQECDEAFSALGSFKCDLLEVCCNEDSTLTATIIQQGGKAFRIGLGNNMDLSTSGATTPT